MKINTERKEKGFRKGEGYCYTVRQQDCTSVIWVPTQFIDNVEYISLVFYYTQQQRKDENQSNAEMVKAVNIMFRVKYSRPEKTLHHLVHQNTQILTFSFDKLVQDARLSSSSTTNHKKLEKEI